MLISEIVNGKDVKNKVLQYGKILKKYDLIREELDIFSQLQETYSKDRRIASKFITELKSDIKNRKWGNLEKQRQQFYEEIKKIYPEIQDNLNEEILNYKFLASIKNFVDDAIYGKLNAKDRMMIEESLVDTLMSGKHIIESVKAIRESNQIPQEVDPLVVNIMMKDFTKKWKQNFTPTQYQYLIEYTANGKAINTKWLNFLRKKFRKVNGNSLLIETKKMFEEAKNILEKRIHLTSEDILNYAELIDEVAKLNEGLIKETKEEMSRMLNENSAGWYKCIKTGNYVKNGKTYKVIAGNFYKHNRVGWDDDYLNNMPMPDEKDFKNLFDTAAYDKPRD